MSLSPATRTRIWTVLGLGTAAVVGYEVAEESLAIPFLVAAALLAVLLAHFLKNTFSAFLLGALIFGNIVGNRGFAQLYLSSSLPLLPAELVLGLTGTVLLITAAIGKRLPIQKDAINFVIAAWIAVSIARLPFDVRSFGAVALRDFVTVAYASFFFIGQDAGSTATPRRFIERCLLVSCVILTIFFPIYSAFPDFFFESLTFRGTPIIYYKGDLAGTFLTVGSVLFYLRFEKGRNSLWLVLSLIAAGETIISRSRASTLALILAAVALAISGRMRYLVSLLAAGAAAVVAIILFTVATDRSWKDTPLYSVYEEAISLTDPSGTRSYSGTDTSDKGDNNQFRAVWWRLTIEETIQTDPWLGMGWGFDLADEFERVYFPEGSEEFNARSPHNILITIFARGGLLSLLPFLALIGLLVHGTLQALRQRADSLPYWLASDIILTSACFGVVLEGPMGAVVFWSVLGIAHAQSEGAEESSAAEDTAAVPAESLEPSGSPAS